MFGLPLRVPEDAAQGPLAVCFVRALGSPLGRLALRELQDAWAELDRRGVRLVAVTPSSLAEARDFVPRYHLLAPLVVDPDRAIAAAWGVRDDAGLADTRATLSPALARRLVHALPLGAGPPRGPHLARAAAFLVGRDGRLAFVSYARSALEGIDLGGLLAACEGAP